MSNLVHRQSKIQEKRKQTPWRQFVMEMASWFNVIIQKTEQGIGRYPTNGRFKNIIQRKDFENTTPLTIEVDLSKSFFTQVEELFIAAPKPQTLSVGENENSLYTESSFGARNAYLCIEVGLGVENIVYSAMIYYNCTNVFNSLQVTNSSNNIYNSKCITLSSNIFYSKFIQNSTTIRFSSNCMGCEECIQCDNLLNQKYCINNKSYSKEEYFEHKSSMIKKLLSNQYNNYQKVTNKGSIISSDDCSGSGIFRCRNIENGYNIARINTGRNVLFGDSEDVSTSLYDGFHVGDNSNDFYGASCCGVLCNGVYCCVWIMRSTNVFYSYNLDSCSFCLGCIGLRNKSYCIFNKQYGKDERYEKVDEIFGQMDKDGTLGDFFPGSTCPFYFNDTAAYLIDPSFTKEEVTAKGYLWRDEPIKVDIPEGAKVVQTSELSSYEGWQHASSGTIVKDLPEWEGDSSTPLSLRSEGRKRHIDPEILKVIIQDESGNVYRIVKMEYDFLMKHGLPLPRKHRLDRMKENFRIE